MVKHYFILTTLVISSFFIPTVHAEDNLLKKPEVQAFIQELVTHDHFDQHELEKIFRNVQPMPEVIHHMTHPAEAFPWDTYQKLFVTQQRIINGTAFTSRYRPMLDEAEKKYHVPPAIIVAILGVESNYGTHVMKYRAIDALSNLAFNYPARQAFFLSELKSFLQLTRKYDLNIQQIYGSYAGAIGPAQFMPDSIMRYAIIFHPDLDLNAAENWIPSIANYFLQKGWQSAGPLVTAITCPVTVPKNIIANSTKNFYTPQQLSHSKISDHAQASAMFLQWQSNSGPQCWLAYHNFAVIMRYNASPLYAMAVVQLSQKLMTVVKE